MPPNRIALFRSLGKETQADIAKKFDVHVRTVDRWERGLNGPDDETKVKLAKYFGTTVDFLMGWATENGGRHE